jgi:hypothetical protein
MYVSIHILMWGVTNLPPLPQNYKSQYSTSASASLSVDPRRDTYRPTGILPSALRFRFPALATSSPHYKVAVPSTFHYSHKGHKFKFRHTWALRNSIATYACAFSSQKRTENLRVHTPKRFQEESAIFLLSKYPIYYKLILAKVVPYRK